jgi:hypothetical protein
VASIIVGAGLGYIVYLDAKDRGYPDASGWAISATLLAVAVIPLYVIYRMRTPPKKEA